MDPKTEFEGPERALFLTSKILQLVQIGDPLSRPYGEPWRIGDKNQHAIVGVQMTENGNIDVLTHEFIGEGAIESSVLMTCQEAQRFILNCAECYSDKPHALREWIYPHP